jgi:hypothetical protein
VILFIQRATEACLTNSQWFSATHPSTRASPSKSKSNALALSKRPKRRQPIPDSWAARGARQHRHHASAKGALAVTLPQHCSCERTIDSVSAVAVHEQRPGTGQVTWRTERRPHALGHKAPSESVGPLAGSERHDHRDLTCRRHRRIDVDSFPTCAGENRKAAWSWDWSASGLARRCFDTAGISAGLYKNLMCVA